MVARQEIRGSEWKGILGWSGWAEQGGKLLIRTLMKPPLIKHLKGLEHCAKCFPESVDSDPYNKHLLKEGGCY